MSAWAIGLLCLFGGVFMGVFMMCMMFMAREPSQKEVSMDSTGRAAVDKAYFWRSMASCPLNAKVQLLGEGGVAVYGTYNGKDTFWNAWAPLPKLQK